MVCTILKIKIHVGPILLVLHYFVRADCNLFVVCLQIIMPLPYTYSPSPSKTDILYYLHICQMHYKNHAMRIAGGRPTAYIHTYVVSWVL